MSTFAHQSQFRYDDIFLMCVGICNIQQCVMLFAGALVMWAPDAICGFNALLPCCLQNMPIFAGLPHFNTR